MTQNLEVPNEQQGTAQQAGKYLFDNKQIPKTLVDATKQRSENNSISIVTPKENGSYKGQVLLNSDVWLVQLVGKEGNTAVVHQKKDIEFVGSSLIERNEHKKLNKADVQIHYKGEKARAYPWKKEKELHTSPKETAKATPLTPETLAAAAKKYAETEIKNVKSRDAFLRHIEGLGKSIAAPEKTAPAQAPGRQAEARDERPQER
ncbi:MAG: hypothetical protein LBG78_07145 [Azoarcus sp.]|jgi:hypothetical protein|nr:hypothetical protein [Azoarcus sp.]